VRAESVSGLRISDGAIEAVQSGTSAVVATNSSGVVIRDIAVFGGIDLSINTHRSLVADNTFRGGRLSLSEANHTVVRGNSFTQAGIRVSESTAPSIVDNEFVSGTVIFAPAVDDAVVRGNRFRAAEFGFVIFGPSRNARVLENQFTGQSYGLYVRVDLLAVVEGLTVSRNTFTDNGAVGLFIEATTVGPVPARISVSDNRFTANGYASGESDAAGRPNDDGLHTNVPIGSDIVVTGNRTQSNADHGIEALPIGSVRDGGGNVSTGDPNGCVGVVCR
jgi:nitrous oxidase accessory protein NosD